MLASVLKRFPSLIVEDVRIQDDGEGPFISKWNSNEPKPTPADLLAWEAEDAVGVVPPKPLEEQLEDKDAQIRELKALILQMDENLSSFMDYQLAKEENGGI